MENKLALQVEYNAMNYFEADSAVESGVEKIELLSQLPED
jgi:hypothetical protein